MENMIYELDVRYSHNDQWSTIELDGLKALREELEHKVLQGWEVKLNDRTLAII